MVSQRTHKKLENYLLQLEINNNTNLEDLIQILGRMIANGDNIGVAMINIFIRNNDIKLQNVKDYKNKLLTTVAEVDTENYIMECNKELEKPYNKGCRISFIPYEELKEKRLINFTKMFN